MTSGLLDTSVVIDWDDPAVSAVLPDQSAISALTLAELAAGPHVAASTVERARRQARLQQVEAAFDPIPFDTVSARSFGLIVAAVTQTGRTHRRRMADLLIAATCHANQLALYTRNPEDFSGLDSLIDVVAV